MKVSVANVNFDNVTMEEAVTRIVQMAQKTDTPRHICTGNLDHLATLAHDEEFLRVYQSADLILADGAPVVWLSHLNPPQAGGPLRERVTGSDLFWELARASATTGLRLFFLGGAVGAADGAARVVCDRYPTAQVCGAYCPPADTFCSEAEQAHIQSILRAARPDILLVGLGAPKQEKWIAANKARLGIPVSIGVGGSFEMASGTVRRAPLWMQHAGMEWVYRLFQEPTRLWRRYFLKDVPFLAKLTTRALLARLAQPFTRQIF